MSLSELSPIHVAKDEERQSPARSFMILQICGKQLHRSVICGAHDFQCVWAVDIVLAVAEWQHSSSLFVLAVCAPIQRSASPCSTLPKVCEDCESGPADVLNVIASKPDLRQHAYYEGLRALPCGFVKAFCGLDAIVGEQLPCGGDVQRHLPVLG